MKFKISICYFFFVFSLKKILAILSLIDQKTYTKSTQDNYNLTGQEVYKDQFTLSLFIRFKSYLYFYSNPSYNMKTILLVNNSTNTKFEIMYTGNHTNFITFVLKINKNLVFYEDLYDLKKSLNNWFFISLTHDKGNLYWYVEDNTNKKIISSKIIKSINPLLSNSDTLIINPFFYDLNIEIAKLKLDKLNALDFYSNLTLKNLTMYQSPIDCDPDCSSCNNQTGVCYKCSTESNPINNTCAANYISIYNYQYFNGSNTSLSDKINIKSKLSPSILQFNSKNYSLMFWIRIMTRNTTTENSTREEEIFRIYVNNTSNYISLFPIILLKSKNSNYMRLTSSISYSLFNTYLFRETWYFVSFSFDSENKVVYGYIKDVCEKQIALNYSSYNSNIIIDPINELTNLAFNNGPLYNYSYFYGIISDFRIYYNSFLTKNDLNTIFNKKNTFSNPFTCKLPFNCSVSCSSIFTSNTNSTCQCTNYIDFSTVSFNPVIVPANNLDDFSIDYWFYSVWLPYPFSSIYFKLIWENHLYVTFSPTTRFTLFCTPNQQLYNSTPIYSSYFVDNNQSRWNYFRCSVSYPNTKLLQILNSAYYYLPRTFVIPRNYSSSPSSSLTLETISDTSLTTNFFIRELRLFKTYLNEKIDLRYRYSIFCFRILSKLDYENLLIYIPFEYLSVSLATVETSNPTNQSLIQMRNGTTFTGEIVLQPDFTNLIICKKNQYFSGDCYDIPSLYKIENCDLQIDKTNCLKCSQNNYLYKGKCYFYCPINHYVNSDNECYPCLEGCSECNMTNPCTKCNITDFNPPNCVQKYFSIFSNSMYKLDIPLNNISNVVTFESYIWIPYTSINSNKVFIDFYPLLIGKYYYKNLFSLFYANNEFKYALVFYYYKEISSMLQFTIDTWHRLVITNDISKSTVSIFIDGNKIFNISQPTKFFQNKGLFTNRLSEQSLTYIRDLRIWTTGSINIINYFDQYKNLLNISKPKNLFAYYPLLEGNGLGIIDIVSSKSVYIDNSKNPTYKNIWTTMDTCGSGNKYNFSGSYCIKCPNNCYSCDILQNTIICNLCNNGYYLSNNLCVESIQKGISMINNQSVNPLIYDDYINNSNFTVIFWIKIFDYNNVINKINDTNNYILLIDPISLYLDNNTKFSLIGPNSSIQMDFKNSFELWTMIGLSWSISEKTGYFYMKNLFYNSTNGIKKLVENTFTIDTIKLGNNCLGLMRSLQIFQKFYSYEETVLISVSTNYKVSELIYYFEYNSTIKSFIDKVTMDKSLNCDKYLMDINEQMNVCDGNTYLENITNSCQNCSESCYGCKSNATKCIKCAPNYYKYGDECVNVCPISTALDTESFSCISFNLIDFTYFNDINFYSTFPISSKGITIEFWGYMKSNDIINFKGYNINFASFLIVELLGGYDYSSCRVNYLGSKNYTLSDSFSLNQWNYIRTAVDFQSYLKINSLNISFYNEEYPSKFTNVIRFSNIDQIYNENNSLYLREFKIWQIVYDNSFDTSRNDISTINSFLIRFYNNFSDIKVFSNSSKPRNESKSIPYNTVPNFPTICSNKFYYSPSNDSCLPTNINLDCKYPIFSNLNGCLSCPEGKLYMDENSTCVTSCPSLRYYTDIKTNICYKCHEQCLTCTEYGRQKCLSCDTNSSLYFIFQNNSCSSSCSLAEELYFNNSVNCINVKNSISQIYINGPDKYNVLGEYNFGLRLTVFTSLYNDSKLLESIDYLWSVDDISKNYLSLNNKANNLEVFLNTEKFNSSTVLVSQFNISIYYNKILLSSASKSIIIKTFNLIPIIQNEKSLIFISNHTISIDASLSYDEMSYDELYKPDNLMSFKWECPMPFNNSLACQTNLTKLTITNDDYFNRLDPLLKYNQTFEFTLLLQKDVRLVKKKFNITLLPNPLSITLKNLIIIFQESNPAFGIASFRADVDPSISIQDLNFFWSVDNVLNEKEFYMNGRDQHILKINLNYIARGINLIKLKVNKLNYPNEVEEIIYSFDNPKVPINGRCIVSPGIGTSMETNFTFYALDWQTDYPPLLYNIIFEGRNNLKFTIFNNFSVSNILYSNKIPAGSNFKLQVKDNSGSIINAPCILTVNENNNISLSKIINSVDNPVEKLKMISIFSTSENNLSYNINDTILILNTIQESVNDSKNIIYEEKIQSVSMGLVQIDKVTSSLELLKNLDKESKNILCDTLDKVVNTSMTYSKNENIVKSAYNIIDNMLKISDFSSDDKMSQNIFNESFYQKINSHTNNLNLHNLDNLVSGDSKTIQTSFLQVNLAKLTKSNIGNISFKKNNQNIPSEASISNNNVNNLKEGCSETSIFCISDKKMKDIYDNANNDKTGVTYGLAIMSAYFKKNSVPIALNKSQFIFSNDNINFSIYKYPIENKFNKSRKRILYPINNEIKLRRLEIEDQKISSLEVNWDFSYEFRLQMDKSTYLRPPKKYCSNNSKFSDSDFMIGNTACVQFNPNLSLLNSSCQTWYDYSNYVILCKCHDPGFISNIWDISISQFYKLKQFPLLDITTTNFSSFMIVGILALLFFINLAVWIISDQRDDKSKTRELKEFDSYQFSYNHFVKNKLHSDRSFYKLFLYILKANHSISVITLYYCQNYTRTMRLIDFFLRFYITIFFSLLPLYFNDDKTKKLIEMRRDINDMDTDINNLPLKIREFLVQLIYSLMASVITFVILLMIDLIYYENVILNNSNKTRYYLKKFIDVCSKQDKKDWVSKLKRSFIKLKAIRYLAEYFCEPSQQFNQINSNTSLKLNDRTINNRKYNLVNIEMHTIQSSKKEKGIYPVTKSQINQNYDIEESFDNKNTKYKKKENKAKNFYSKRGKNLLFFENLTSEKREILLSDSTNESHVYSLNKKDSIVSTRSFTKFTDINDSKIHIPKIVFLRNGQFAIKEHKYSLTFIGTYYIKIDIDDYQYFIEESKCPLSSMSKKKVKFNNINSDNMIVYYNLSIISKKIQPNINLIRLRKICKIIVSLSLIFIMLSYMINFISFSYKEYGNKFFFLWILPIMMMIFSNLFVIQVIMIFIFTLILNIWGKAVYFKKKMGIIYLIINYIIPQEIVVMHKSVIEFREIYDRINKVH